jgi:hypothetical protein
MLSGIGAPEVLQKRLIPAKHATKEVGENFSDYLTVGLT